MTTTSRSDTVMPTGINVDRMAWLREMQRLLARPYEANALFEFVDHAMTAARMQALLDVTEYDADDPATHPQDGQVVAVLTRFSTAVNAGEPWWSSPGGPGRWLWVPPEATDE